MTYTTLEIVLVVTFLNLKTNANHIEYCFKFLKGYYYKDCIVNI